MNTSLKILWLAPHPIRPGEHPAPWLVTLATELARAGHRLTVLTPSPRTTQVQRIATDQGYELIIVPFKGGIRHLLSGFRTQISSMSAFLRQGASTFDVIHVHGTEMQLATSVMEAQTGTPYIISIQGILSLYKDKLPQKFSKRYLYWSLASRYEKQEVRYSPNFFCRTDWDQHFVRHFQPRASITTCWEMLRPDFFQYRHSFTGKGILFMGGDNPLKALTLCLKVFGHLIVRQPDLRLHIVGSVNAAAYRRLVHNIDARPLSTDNVVFHGALDAQGICRLYTECFCLYHPSLIDNSPNSVCEAQVAGLPVIATRVGGVPSLIDDGRTGLLIRKNDEAGHVATLERLYRDSGLQRWISRNSREVARQRHDTATILETTLNTYRTLAAASASNVPASATNVLQTTNHVTTQIPA
ncbi:MAG TPA: glycosyltransferase family 4 protein [Puia sp.]|jgi:glycosyltransferase involved in cell wall biosynthesis|nr:glycosyltransferase family 4 protein [Puia sp.]